MSRIDPLPEPTPVSFGLLRGMTVPAQVAPRVATLDVYRGLVMLLMMAEVLQFAEVAEALKSSAFWNWLAHHQSHVEWAGLTLHDLIQPSFSFLVGAALPYSISSRERLGQSEAAIVLRGFKRALILILLGFFLRSIGKPLTYFTFEDTLTQIGLGYGFLVLLGWQSPRVLWGAFGAILATYWLAFALHPLPAAGFDMTAVGVTKDWPYGPTGFAAHWGKNTNLAAHFDVWFLNLFPREAPFIANDGGYQTLNFIPTLATMILGALAAHTLRAPTPHGEKVHWLVLYGALGIACGAALDWLGICPVVKRIWTPSWVLASGGFCFWILAALYAALDWHGWRRWAFPLIVIGTNSIAAYLLTEILREPLRDLLKAHVALLTLPFGATAYQSVLSGALVLVVIWSILLWLYRRGMYLRV